jgi:predicted nuclease with TOPRIM domain
MEAVNSVFLIYEEFKRFNDNFEKLNRNFEKLIAKLPEPENENIGTLTEFCEQIKNAVKVPSE